jgi:hypothetical protein
VILMLLAAWLVPKLAWLLAAFAAAAGGRPLDRHLGLSPDEISERLGRNDPRYFNYWQAWRTVGPMIVGGGCG